jgi:ABC-type phosphate/phosphonate transport system ATPase subunit
MNAAPPSASFDFADIRPGCFVNIIGKRGTGKTALLKHLLRRFAPSHKSSSR